MGILKDAGVDPPEPQDSQPSSKDTNRAEVDATKNNLWREMGAVFTNSSRRKEFLAFIRNGFRA
jgi:hypothetical protein